MFFDKTLTAQEVADQFQLVSNIAGDFNRDGRVDAADYTTWRDGLGDDFSSADYLDWKSNFGAAAQESGGAARASRPVTIPEPTGISLLLFAWAMRFGRIFPSNLSRRGSLACVRLAS